MEGDSAQFWPSNAVQIGTLPFPVNGREGGCVLPGGCGGNPFPAAPQEILVHAGARSRLGERAREWGQPLEVGCLGRVSGPLPELPPPPAGTFLPSPPLDITCGLTSSVSWALERLCFANFPGKGRGYALVWRARSPQAFRCVPGPGRGGPLDSVCGYKYRNPSLRSQGLVSL